MKFKENCYLKVQLFEIIMKYSSITMYKESFCYDNNVINLVSIARTVYPIYAKP